MTPDIPLRDFKPGQVLCINRKIHDSEVKARQSAFVDRFAQGCDGAVVSFQEACNYPVDHPWYIRGMKFTMAINHCWQTGRTFYYTDNGYLGNVRSKSYFRIIKNHVHEIRPIIPRARDRLDVLDFYTLPHTTGRKILIAPPSVKSFSLWDMDPDVWVAQVVEQLKAFTDRPIEIRLKRSRSERMSENTMYEALADDVHCLITYNSVAAVEAVMLGKPAICLGPNAATVVANTSLSEVENLKFPTDDEREAWMRHLSYSQFTYSEMSDGTAWRILTDHDTGL
jgi:hypothetical protein